MFVKSPVPGDVKTRLIPHLTGTEAANLYKCFVGDTIKKVTQLVTTARIQVAYQPCNRSNDLSWLDMRKPPEQFRQEGRSLGERLVHAFGVAFGRGCRHVVIIGSDSPTLPPSYLENAFRALEEADVVLGPSVEGGYYLVGLSRPCLKIFEDVCWSSDHVFERTVRNAQARNYKLKVLPSHYDVETFDDLKWLHKQLAKNQTDAPLTKKFLASLAKTNAALIASLIS